MTANKHFSYDLVLDMSVEGLDRVQSNTIHLHDQLYHYLQTPATSSGAEGQQQQW